MKAMILAAGEGTRLRPLTNNLPKALVEVRGRPVIETHLRHLATHGFNDIVINIAYLGDQIKQYIGDGRQFGVNVTYSEEDQPLETGGGILNALPLLGDQPFLAVNADIVTDYPFSQLKRPLMGLAHCVLVKRPEGEDDFGLKGDRLVIERQGLTYSGIAVYSPALFQGCQSGKFSVTPLLRQAIAQQQVTGEFYDGEWHDIGTFAALERVSAAKTEQ